MSRMRLFIVPLACVFLSGFLGGAHAQSDWEKDWERTVEAARKEGQVNVYVFRYWRSVEAFAKDFPEIRLSSVTGSGSDLTLRLLAEKRAQKHIADVFMSGASSYNVLYKAQVLDPLKPLLALPEVVDESKWYGGKKLYLDPKGEYNLAYGASPGTQMYYNSTLVKPSDFRSMWDLLNPKYKGKIVSLDPTLTTIAAGLQFLYYHPDLGPKFMRRLFGEMDVTFSRDPRQMIDWLAQGKFALCFGCRGGLTAKRQGLPVESFDGPIRLKEAGYLTVGGNTISFVNHSPHPNAAKVFVNWFLSRKGQMAHQKLGDPDDAPNSLRMDIPKDDVPVANRLHPGVRYLDVTRSEFSDVDPIFKLTKEIMKELGSAGR